MPDKTRRTGRTKTELESVEPTVLKKPDNPSDTVILETGRGTSPNDNTKDESGFEEPEIFSAHKNTLDTIILEPGRKTLEENAHKSPEPPVSGQVAIKPGTLIKNRFVIDKQLGTGGMGMVFRALDKRKQEAQDRDPYVAIKILSEEFKRHPKSFVALQREARKSQTLAHPNIITVYDFDRDGDVVFMTMEELKGQPLDKLIKNNPQGVPTKLALQMIKSIAQGLQYAHSKHIVHSDLKPGNIFVTEDNQIKVLDFGIAQAVSNIGDAQGDKTVFDVRSELGGLTPVYASYETWQGADPHPSDDIYALGLISYELLTGTHPYYRKPATLALEKKLTAKRISGLKSAQAKALQAAIAIKRSDRQANAQVFLQQFDRTPISKKMTASLVILIGIVAVLGGLTISDGPEFSGPDVPFDELPGDVQVSINQRMEEGQTALQSAMAGNVMFLRPALEIFNSAWELHPRNPDITAALNSVVEAYLGQEFSGSTQNKLEQQLTIVDSLLEQPALIEDRRLLELRASLVSQLNTP